MVAAPHVDGWNRRDLVMRAVDVMATSLLTVTPATTIDVAIKLMLDHHVSGLPVVDADGTLAGIITEGDLLRRSETGTGERRRSKFMEFLVGPGREAKSYVHSHSRRVSDLMTSDVVTVTPATPLESVVELMETRRIRRVCVMTGNTLVGLVSRADLLRALAQKLAALPHEEVTDEGIRAALMAELEAAKWVSCSNINIDVRDRMVTLEGFIYDERMRAALNVAAQNVDGVLGVVDNLVWLDTTTGLIVPS
jgi:CBS domain-containing protein